MSRIKQANTFPRSIACIASAVLLAACQHGKAKTSSGTFAAPPPDAEMSSIASDSTETTTLTLPAGDIAKVISYPATPESPARTETLYTLAKDVPVTRRIISSEATVSPPRKADTSVALHKLDLEERRWLLFIAIGLGVAGIAAKSLLPAWPGLPRGLFLGAAIALASWKLSEIPGWAWGAAVLVSILLALGYKRAEADKHSEANPPK